MGRLAAREIFFKAPKLKYQNTNKFKITNFKYQTDMSTYDLEARTLVFASDVRKLCRQLEHTIANREDVKQLIRSSGSVGANYIEANESLSKKDLAHRMRIARKEAKESRYWLQLLYVPQGFEPCRARLLQEATELLRILSSIIEKVR